MIEWFMLNFAGREKCKGCQSGSWEQMSYSSWSSSIRLSFPISSHNWQPRFTSGGKGRGVWDSVPGDSAILFHQPESSRREATMNIWWKCLPRNGGETLHHFTSIGLKLPHSTHVYLFKRWPLVNHRGIWDSLLLPLQLVAGSSWQSVCAAH